APAFGAPPNTRPEIPAQVTENMESAPGNARTLEAVGGGYAARAEPRASLRAEPVGDAPALGAPPNDRPEIPLQTIENMESAPGNGCRRPGPAGAALPASHFPAKRSTSKNFCTLPVGVRGRGSFWNRMVRGILKPASRSRQWASRRSAVGASAPAAVTISAATRSPQVSSG